MRASVKKRKKGTKKTIIPQVNIPLNQILPVVRLGLIALSNEKPVRVLELRVMNIDVLYCEFRAYGNNSIDIKAEIYSIMSFFGSFFKDDSLGCQKFTRYGVKAFDEKGKPVLYAISSSQAAQRRDSIEWMKTTLFQDMTLDYSLGVAKRMIAEIEKALRTIVVEGLKEQFGSDWWNTALNNKLGLKIRGQYKDQYGVDETDGAVLIQHTYLNNLSDIILTHWVHFRSILPSRQQFDDAMVRLNLIRREEAHNREINAQHLADLEGIYNLILPKISERYDWIVPLYLVDNWRLKVKEVMSEPYRTPVDSGAIDTESDPARKLSMILAATRYAISDIEGRLEKLNGVIVPVQKRGLHAELVGGLMKWTILLREKEVFILTGDLPALQRSIEDLNQQQILLDEFSKRYVLSES